ncbi:MAG: hypothetical protein AAFV49_05600 [Pseudomonadota bacterium]
MMEDAMGYYDHATMMQFGLGPWSGAPTPWEERGERAGSPLGSVGALAALLAVLLVLP